MRLCLARVVTPRLTRAMSRPPYFRPYGAQAFTRAVSASARISVPRFWRIYLALWLISRWRLPATPCLILPVAVNLKRFLTPLLVLSLGIFVSFGSPRSRGRRYSNRHGMPFGRAIGFSNDLESAALYWRHPTVARSRVDGTQRRSGTDRRDHAAPHHPRPQGGRRNRFLQESIRR